MEVDLFIPCFIDQLYPETAFNTIKILEKVGCKVNYNPDQTCCGQPFYNSGHWDKSRDLAEKFFADFPGERLIISPSGSCTAFVKNHYHKLFKDDEQKVRQCQTFGARVVELSDFLVNHLKIKSLGASLEAKVTFHDSCHATRDYKLKDEARELIRHVKGLELIEMDETEECCGFGGTFSAKFKAVSSAMVENKVQRAMATGADYIVSTEASCIMNIQGYIMKHKLPIKTAHLADIISSGI